MAGQQSSFPASAQGRWTSSSHHQAPPEPAGHGALQLHRGLSEQPTSELGTGPTKHHREPGEVIGESGERWRLHFWNNTLVCMMDVHKSFGHTVSTKQHIFFWLTLHSGTFDLTIPFLPLLFVFSMIIFMTIYRQLWALQGWLHSGAVPDLRRTGMTAKRNRVCPEI